MGQYFFLPVARQAPPLPKYEDKQMSKKVSPRHIYSKVNMSYMQKQPIACVFEGKTMHAPDRGTQRGASVRTCAASTGTIPQSPLIGSSKCVERFCDAECRSKVCHNEQRENTSLIRTRTYIKAHTHACTSHSHLNEVLLCGDDGLEHVREPEGVQHDGVCQWLQACAAIASKRHHNAQLCELLQRAHQLMLGLRAVLNERRI